MWGWPGRAFGGIYCPEAPRRYRGRDLFHWLMHVGRNGADVGFGFPTPSPSGRFACNPLLTGAHGRRDIHLRDLARQGVALHGRLETVEDGVLLFSDDFPERLRMVEANIPSLIVILVEIEYAIGRLRKSLPQS